MATPERSTPKPKSAELFRRSYLLSIVVLYTCLSVFAWTVLCVQNNRPITTTYTYSYNPKGENEMNQLSDKIKQNQDWFRVVKVLLAITNTLVLPLTSTVCASAAVIYVQNYGRQRNFTMMHTSTLADKGWMSPQVWLTLLTKEGWKSRGSLFLLFTIALHVLGFIIGPLQQYYINQEAFKFQTIPSIGFSHGADIFSLLGNGWTLPEIDEQTTRLRNMLASVGCNDFQSQLWQEDTPQCSPNSSINFEVTPECYDGGATFKNVSTLLDPYFVQLPSGYNTGLLTQFVPRINSSIHYSNVSVNEFPPGCKDIPGAYYIEYVYNETIFKAQVCMPNDQSKSPWRPTRDRQEISESLFLNLIFDPYYNQLHLANTTFKVSVNTTLGYFELPNYRIGPKGGSLLTKDPSHQSIPPHTLRRSLQVNESDDGFVFHTVGNKGPLAMVTAALFEPGSFIATQLPTYNAAPPIRFDKSSSHAAIPCAIPPLELIRDCSRPDSAGRIWDSGCVPIQFDTGQSYAQLSNWLAGFYGIKSMENALLAAVILASQVWLTTDIMTGNTDVSYDLGQDFVRPKISAIGVKIISILLATDIFLLVALAIYVRLSYTWTSSFDPSTMMRLAVTRADKLLLTINSPAEEKKMRSVLENMPGWVGDGRPEDKDMGVVALGALAPLKSGRHYLVG